MSLKQLTQLDKFTYRTKNHIHVYHIPMLFTVTSLGRSKVTSYNCTKPCPCKQS